MPAGIKIVPVAALDWPSDPSELPRAKAVQRAGSSFLDLEARALGWMRRSSPSPGGGGPPGGREDSSGTGTSGSRREKKESIDLFGLSEEELAETSYYDVLGGAPIHSGPELLKKYYRKACLRYHPDKSGRGEEDAVFLAVKAAFETLSDPAKKRSYDSTMDFDDSIPPGGEAAADFYGIYGPVFARNLRFDQRFDPQNAAKKGGGGGGRKGGGRRKGKGGGGGGGGGRAAAEDGEDPPDLGDDGTPLAEVHAFYDYWTRFDSWRDFTLKAQKMSEHDVEMADSRDEKRWMEKEIVRKTKALKREEVARIALLVERAMGADPRLRREKEREREEKRLAAEGREREREERERREAEERERREAEEAERAARETEERAGAKARQKEEKKRLRKARQLLWKLAVAAHGRATTAEERVWPDIEKMHDDVDVINDSLGAAEIAALAVGAFGDGGEEGASVSGLAALRVRVEEVRGQNAEAGRRAEAEKEERRAAAAAREAAERAARAMRPWTKKELAALAKGVKKYPRGGANRWSTIATFVNNLCKQEEGPRSKEECIEQYGILSKERMAGGDGSGEGAAAAAAAAAALAGGGGAGSDAAAAGEAAAGADPAPWTDEENLALQKLLAKYPASMDKNARWTAIAKGLPGRTKKDCVQRFKAIRLALKAKK